MNEANDLTTKLIHQLEGLINTLDGFGGLLNDPNLDPKAYQIFTSSDVDTALATLYDSVDCGEVSEMIGKLKQL